MFQLTLVRLYPNLCLHYVTCFCISIFIDISIIEGKGFKFWIFTLEILECANFFIMFSYGTCIYFKAHKFKLNIAKLIKS